MIHALASINEAEVIRDPGFSQWLVYTLVGLMIVDRLRAWIIPSKREISGSIETREERKHADKDELDTVKGTFEAEVKALHGLIAEMKLASATAKTEQIEAAQKRENNIKESFRKEAATMGDRLVTKIENVTREAFQQINQHGERLAKLETIAKTWRD